MFVVVLVTVVVVSAFVGLPDVESLRRDSTATGPVAPALFVLLFAAMTLAPLPKNVLVTAAGLLFGFVWGIAIALAGAMLGAMTAFALGRVLGRDAVERVAGARIVRADELMRRNGLLTVIGARLAPVVPFTGINYAAGLAAIRTRDYVIGTAIGIIPGTIAYAALGAYGSSRGRWPFIVAIVALAALTLTGVAVTRGAHRLRITSTGSSDTNT